MFIIVIYYTATQEETKLHVLVCKQILFFMMQILLETHSAPFCHGLCSCQQLSGDYFEDECTGSWLNLNATLAISKTE